MWKNCKTYVRLSWVTAIITIGLCWLGFDLYNVGQEGWAVASWVAAFITLVATVLCHGISDLLDNGYDG